MDLNINKGGAMINLSTILRNGERVMKLVPVFKDLLPNNGEPDSELYKLIKKGKEQDDALYAKKQEITVLNKNIEDLERLYKSKQRHIWKLEETVKNCKYQINLLTKALTKGE
jgi:predicted RNase H-like nuclease (RuvC/YqgF family)